MRRLMLNGQLSIGCCSRKPVLPPLLPGGLRLFAYRVIGSEGEGDETFISANIRRLQGRAQVL